MFAPLNRVIYDTHHEQWFNVSIALSWQKPSQSETSSRRASSSAKSKKKASAQQSQDYGEGQDVPFHEELKSLLQQIERAYYFGVFTVFDEKTQSKKIEVAAFRHIKDKANKNYYWFVYNPRFKQAIDVERNAKKYRAWCRRVIEADIYLLERDKKSAPASTTKKS